LSWGRGRPLSHKGTINAVPLPQVRGPRLRSLPPAGRGCNIEYMAAHSERPITDALRRAIAESGLSFKRLERETGVLRQSLMKFANGERTLRGDKYDALALFFDLELRPKRNRG